MDFYHQHYDSFWPQLAETKLQDWQTTLPPLTDQALNPEGNGNLPRWLPALEAIFQTPRAQHIALDSDLIRAYSDSPVPPELKAWLLQLKPWRKGPFEIEGIHIDTEWRSDWKWQRVQPYLKDLSGRRVLDIGCGSGYHLWRMLGQGAELAVGVDPSLLFMSQFLVFKHFAGDDQSAFFLPLTLEQLPITPQGGAFDTVFSMGVLYHRRSPIDHIMDLKRHLAPGGQLVLETLVIPESYGQILVPQSRYAQMNNVWFLPNVEELAHWMTRCGLKNVRCVDLDQTSIEEQRTTEWMDWNSLKDFLDPLDPNLTVEGYPAPLRAVMTADMPK